MPAFGSQPDVQWPGVHRRQAMRNTCERCENGAQQVSLASAQGDWPFRLLRNSLRPAAPVQ